MRITLRLLANRVVYFPPKQESIVKDLVERVITAKSDCIIVPFLNYPAPLSEVILRSGFRSLTVCERDVSVAKKLKVSPIIKVMLDSSTIM